MANIEFITIPAITAIVYTIIDVAKTAIGDTDKFARFIPLVELLLGGICGIVATFVAPEIIGQQNLVVAFVIGAASGLAATGANQIAKQLTKGGKDDGDGK